MSNNLIGICEPMRIASVNPARPAFESLPTVRLAWIFEFQNPIGLSPWSESGSFRRGIECRLNRLSIPQNVLRVSIPTMRTSRIKAKLSQNLPVLVTTLHYSDPSIYEMASLMGFDGLWLDLEHHHHSVETANTLLRAARVGASDVMVRPAKGESMRMGRILEAGANGIMSPRCDNAAEAREVVRWAKFAPQGERGIDSANADNPYCMMPLAEYIRFANEQTFIVIQIEDPKALINTDEIAAVPGVDIVFFGPGDFSILSGIPGQWDHPLIKDAMQKVAAAVQKSGKHWGMPIFSVEHAHEVLGLGGRFLAHGADLLIVKTGLEDIQRRFAPLGVTFERSA